MAEGESTTGEPQQTPHHTGPTPGDSPGKLPDCRMAEALLPELFKHGLAPQLGRFNEWLANLVEVPTDQEWQAQQMELTSLTNSRLISQESLHRVTLDRWCRATMTVAAVYHGSQGRQALRSWLYARIQSWDSPVALLKSEPAASWILTPTALELLPPEYPVQRLAIELGQTALNVDHRLALQLMSDKPFASVGPDLEPKLRICGVRLALDELKSGMSPTSLHLTLVPTTWTRGRGFHRALETRQQPGNCSSSDLAKVLSLLPEQLSSSPSVPDIAALHIIVRTSDDWIPLLQRSPQVAYAPGHWSASLEEQWTLADFELSPSTQTEDGSGPPGASFVRHPVSDLALRRAAQRAVQEELDIELPLELHEPGAGRAPSCLLSLYMELQFISIGAVVLVNCRETRAELETRFLRRAEGPHGWESSGLRWVKAVPEMLESLERESDTWPLHPTAGLRLRLLARALRQGR